LADISRGELPIGQGSTAVWQQKGQDPQDSETGVVATPLTGPLSGLIKGKLKAAEKVASIYDGDVSQLKDLCRQSIIFESVDDLTLCLEALLADDELVVERIVNRLDPAVSAYKTLGFRSLIVNLRIDVDMTRKLGIETHVCELQLTLKAIYNRSTSVEYQEYRKDYLRVRGVLKKRRSWIDMLSATLWPHMNASSRSERTGLNPHSTGARLLPRLFHFNRIGMLTRLSSDFPTIPKSRPTPQSRRWPFLVPEDRAVLRHGGLPGEATPAPGMTPSFLCADDSDTGKLVAGKGTDTGAVDTHSVANDIVMEDSSLPRRQWGVMYKPSLAGLFSEEVRSEHAEKLVRQDTELAHEESAGPDCGAVSACEPPQSPYSLLGCMHFFHESVSR
jgi:hypothetical protein